MKLVWNWVDYFVSFYLYLILLNNQVHPYFIYADLEFVFVPIVVPKPILFAINIQESVIEAVCACPLSEASDYQESLIGVVCFLFLCWRE